MALSGTQLLPGTGQRLQGSANCCGTAASRSLGFSLILAIVLALPCAILVFFFLTVKCPWATLCFG